MGFRAAEKQHQRFSIHQLFLIKSYGSIGSCVGHCLALVAVQEAWAIHKCLDEATPHEQA